QLVRDSSRPPRVKGFPGVTLVQWCVKVIQQRHDYTSHRDFRPITQVPRQGLTCQELRPSAPAGLGDVGRKRARSRITYVRPRQLTDSLTLSCALSLSATDCETSRKALSTDRCPGNRLGSAIPARDGRDAGGQTSGGEQVTHRRKKELLLTAVP